MTWQSERALVTMSNSASSTEQVTKARAILSTINEKQAKKRASSEQEKAMASLKNRQSSREVLLRRCSSAVSEDPALRAPAEAPPGDVADVGPLADAGAAEADVQESA